MAIVWRIQWKWFNELEKIQSCGDESTSAKTDVLKVSETSRKCVMGTLHRELECLICELLWVNKNLFGDYRRSRVNVE